jgi:hypothetical protein
LRIEWHIEVNGGNRKEVEEQMQMRRLPIVRGVCEVRGREMGGGRHALRREG